MTLSANEIQDQNRSEAPTQTVTNTVYGNLISKCLATRQPFTLPQYTTLNEFYGVLATESIGPKNGGDFELKYFGLGVRGSDCIGVDANGKTRLKVNQHQPIDANLFIPIPLICRPLENDLDATNRAKYRMRVVETIDTQVYVFYYLKVIDFGSYNPQVNKITRDEATGNEVPVPFVPVKDDLFNPQPVDFTSAGSVPVSNVYMNSSAILDCSLSNADLQELVNAVTIKFKDPSYASINETCIVYGIDTVTDGEISQGAVVRYNEVMSAVIAHFITERDGRNAVNNVAIKLAYDHGSSEPMLVQTVATTTSV